MRAFVDKKIIKLAFPMAMTQLITTASGFLCMMMLAQLGHKVLAASALIFSISLSIAVIGMSLLLSLSILVGHAYGAKNYLGIGALLQQGWLLALVISVPIMIIYLKMETILIFFGQQPSIAQIVQEFFNANIWRVVPLLLGVCNQQLCYGVHKQKIDLVANTLGVVVLVAASYLLILGKLGFPKLGVAGFGYAYAIQGWFYFLFTTLYLYFHNDFIVFRLFQIRIHQNWSELARLFKLAWPFSLQISGEMLSFLVCTTFVGWLGTNALAAFQVMMQYQFLVVIPIFSLSQASGILIGQAYGSKQFAQIRKLGYDSIRLGMLISTITGLVFLLFPKVLASLYLDVNDPSNAQTLHFIVILLMLLAITQFFDSIRNILVGSLRGLLDMKYPMAVGLFCIWLVGIPLAYYFAFTLHWGVIGIMLGFMVGMFLGGITLLQRWHNITAMVIHD